MKKGKHIYSSIKLVAMAVFCFLSKDLIHKTFLDCGHNPVSIKFEDRRYTKDRAEHKTRKWMPSTIGRRLFKSLHLGVSIRHQDTYVLCFDKIFLAETSASLDTLKKWINKTFPNYVPDDKPLKIRELSTRNIATGFVCDWEIKRFINHMGEETERLILKRIDSAPVERFHLDFVREQAAGMVASECVFVKTNKIINKEYCSNDLRLLG